MYELEQPQEVYHQKYNLPEGTKLPHEIYNPINVDNLHTGIEYLMNVDKNTARRNTQSPEKTRREQERNNKQMNGGLSRVIRKIVTGK